MTKVVVKSRVGVDGVLRLTVPLGEPEKEREVTVTIEEAASKPFDRMEWHNFLASIQGKWEGGFERPPQTLPEVREAFP